MRGAETPGPGSGPRGGDPASNSRPGRQTQRLLLIYNEDIKGAEEERRSRRLAAGARDPGGRRAGRFGGPAEPNPGAPQRLGAVIRGMGLP